VDASLLRAREGVNRWDERTLLVEGGSCPAWRNGTLAGVTLRLLGEKKGVVRLAAGSAPGAGDRRKATVLHGGCWGR